MRLPSYQTISPDETSPLNTQVVEQGTFSPIGSNDSTPATLSSSLTPAIMTKKASGVIALLGVTWCGMLLYLGISPLSMDALKPWNYRSLAGGANTIKMCVKEMVFTTKQNSVGALVDCWDRDSEFDDKMCEGTTGQDGCVVMNYKKDAWDGWGGNNPDIYCSVNKQGFVQSTPPDKDHHDQSKQAEFETTLYRDRSGDYGHTNKCGPAATEGLGFNDVGTLLIQFEDQCFQHDKCYWDCQILQKFKWIQADAQEFCDKEMLAGMESSCYYQHGNLPGGGDSLCVASANTVYTAGLRWGATLLNAYSISEETCGTEDPSFKNNYDPKNPPCIEDGKKCGYDGTTSDKNSECKNCCNSGIAKNEGTFWDDWYCGCLPWESCGCLPHDYLCGTTLIGRAFDNCHKCCSESNPPRVSVGWTWNDKFCK